LEQIHSLLKRQLKRYFGSANPPESWDSFMLAVNEAYLQFNSDRAMLERSLDLSSQELLQANSHMRVVFERIINSTVDGIFAFDRDCRYTVWNPGMEQISGVKSDKVIGKPIFEVFPSIKKTGEDDLVRKALEGKSVTEKGRPRFLAEGGESGLFESFYSPLLNERGEITGGLAIIRDVTEQMRAEGLLIAQKSVLEVVAREGPLPQVLNVLIRVIEEQSRGVLCSVLLLDKKEQVLRLGAAPNLPVSYHQAIDGMKIGPEIGSCGAAAYRREPVIVPDISIHPYWKDFREVALKHGLKACWSVPILSSAGEVFGTFAMYYRSPRNPNPYELRLIEISSHLAGIAIQRRRGEETLAEQAIRDTLTDLYNRRYFNRRIEEEIAQANRESAPLAILLCDLDRFKRINDTYGHQTGDEVLRAVAKSVQTSTRGSDLVFRWGGDEIVVVLPGTSREVVTVATDRIRNSIQKINETIRLDLDLSIGVALYPEHGRDIDELIRLADRALYIAKEGGDKVHIGEEEYSLGDHSIKVVFQPIFDIRSNQPFGYEALSRDPSGKLSILEMFKRYQAIGQLSELKRICFQSQYKKSRELGLKRVFINVDFDLLRQLEDVPRPDEIDVVLEISELEALHDVESRIKMTRKWRSGGFRFAIDDFGAGFISLPFIARATPDYIKVDRSTLLMAVESEKFRKLLKGLVHALRNHTREGIIAEGVENEKELGVVKELDIDFVQGYLFGKPQEIK
jgi:diguanylate cyclase (GGDEF)-like protein/PAS domain S-box-containing protein